MAHALNESAFMFGSAEELWRASCAWRQQSSEQAEYLHEMAVDLIEIRELPTYQGTPQRPVLIAPTPTQMLDVREVHELFDGDIPF